jgi:CRISPR-associated protein Cas5d
MDDYSALQVRVWGEYACFTRPEMKVERVTYPVPTASAARGILESIFWKPEFTWDIREIWVLRPIRYASIVRNEVKSKAALSTVRRWAKEGGGYEAANDRTQRHSLVLRDVAYLIHAQVRVHPDCDAHPAKFRDQFRRRVDRGQCYLRPYLGCREFSADFGPPQEDEQPIAESLDLGRMLLDIDYDAEGDGRGVPRFFQAQMVSGIIRYPSLIDQEA